MNAALIKNWNKVVSQKDKVYILGDFSFGNKEMTKEIVRQLHGYKILIMGNHDRGHGVKWWQECGFDIVSPHPMIIEEFIVLQHEPPAYFNDDIPFAYIYGHVHATEMYQTTTKRSACVSVERWNYTPVELKTILSFWA